MVVVTTDGQVPGDPGFDFSGLTVTDGVISGTLKLSGDTAPEPETKTLSDVEVLAFRSQAATIQTFYVPAGASIQAAIDAADSFDTILLGPGVYTEVVEIDQPNLVIDSQRGANETTLKGAILVGEDADNTSIARLTIDAFTGSEAISVVRGVDQLFVNHTRIQVDGAAAIATDSGSIGYSEFTHNTITGHTGVNPFVRLGNDDPIVQNDKSTTLTFSHNTISGSVDERFGVEIFANASQVDDNTFDIAGAVQPLVLKGAGSTAAGNTFGTAPVADGTYQVVFGAGANVFEGVAAADAVALDAGADRFAGRGGDDTAAGEAGGDVLSGADTLFGNRGADVLGGGRGADVLGGGRGADVLAGGRGADALSGGGGDDQLSGGRWSDALRGGAGDDALVGGGGEDVLFGGRGDDTLTGGAGGDSFVFAAGPEAGADVVTDFTLGLDTAIVRGLGDPLAVTEAVDFADLAALAALAGGTATVSGADLVVDFAAGSLTFSWLGDDLAPIIAAPFGFLDLI